MAGSDDRCDVCKLQGLAVYPSRYAVVPKTFDAPALGPFDDKSVTGVALTQSKYGLRQLREGFVYLLYESGPRGRFIGKCIRSRRTARSGSSWIRRA